MLSSGEKLDMVFLMSNIREDGQRGQLYPINDLVETYAPDAYSAMERYIEACYFDGDLYGLPTYRDLASQAGFMCRADMPGSTSGTLSDDSVGSEQWMFPELCKRRV